MSLSAHDQQALDGIAHGLAHSDPALASLLATFNRLTSAEAMPGSEKILVARRDPAVRARRLYARLGFERVALIVWLVLGIVLVAVALTVGHGTAGRGCARSWPGCAGEISGQTTHAAAKSWPSSYEFLTREMTGRMSAPRGTVGGCLRRSIPRYGPGSSAGSRPGRPSRRPAAGGRSRRAATR